MYLERLNPWRFLKDTLEEVPEYLQIASELPATMKRITRVLDKGKMQVEVNSPQLELLVRKLDRMSNQMSFSIVLLGLIICSSISGAQTIVWRLPMLEIGNRDLVLNVCLAAVRYLSIWSFLTVCLLVFWSFVCVFDSSADGSGVDEH